MPKTSRFCKGFAVCLLALIGLVLLSSCTPPVSKKSAQKGCLDCHSEYSQQFSKGVVHQPVKEAKCNTCHRTHGQIGGVFLRELEPELCFRCHRQLENNLQQFKSVHTPVSDGTCQECHSPHNSANEKLLIEKDELLCFKCHSQQPFKGKNIHQPVAEGCSSCHPAHGSIAAGLLTHPKEDLCASCHSLEAKSFVDKHGGFSVTKNCLECHSVHSSDQNSLLKKIVHDPVAELECGSCHEGPQKADAALVSAAAELCLQCHDDVDTAAKDAHEPMAGGDCLECHSPHASDFSGMLAIPSEALCFQCHEFNFLGPEPEKPGKGSAHTIVAEGDCQSCHSPHQAEAGQSKLLKAPAEQLCLECHDDVAAEKTVNHPPVQEGLCLTCHLSHESEVSGVLIDHQQKLCAQCHETVTEDMGKLSLHRPFSGGQCSACHNPHGSSAGKLLTGSAAQSCDSCHLKLATERQDESRHSPFVEGECATCHSPHSSDRTTLLVDSVGSICLDCHDDKQPVAFARDRHENCVSCHAPHGNEGDSFLAQSLPQLCLNCHTVDAYWGEGVGHQPAMDGECITCHDPHFSDESNIVKENWGKDLCGQCHEVETATLKASHQGIDPGADSCRSCHNPHGGPDNTLTHPMKHEPFSDGDCTVCHTGA